MKTESNIGNDPTGQTNTNNQFTNTNTQMTRFESHFHNVEKWIGNGAVEDSLTGYTLTSGNNAFGTEVLLLDTGDTPIVAGKLYFDAHTNGAGVSWRY